MTSEDYSPGNDTLYLDLTRKWAARLATKLEGLPYDDSDEPLPATPTPDPVPEPEVEAGLEEKAEVEGAPVVDDDGTQAAEAGVAGDGDADSPVLVHSEVVSGGADGAEDAGNSGRAEL